MKKLILIVLVLLVLSVTAFADVFVSGYTRSDGTYVKPL